MSTETETVIAYAHQHKTEFLQDLKDLVAIPSESTSPDCAPDVRRAAEWLLTRLGEAGATASEIIETPRHPVVWAEFRSPSPHAPTVLIYGHYDVQPVDPVELWETDPYTPTIRGDRLYGRGASDMKAQVLVTLEAVRSWTQTSTLPVNIRFILEGEEEIGSPNLADVIRNHADKFAADVCLNPDTGMLGTEIPTIRYGLRGLAYFQLTLRGPERDLHSGAFGGVVHNPAQAIAEVVAGMHDADGRVTLNGFYDRVRVIDAEEKERLSLVPFGDDDGLRLSGVPRLWGDPDFTVIERITARPTLEINGIWGGYTGEGAKTVIPAEAHAKISMRLVPDQRPDEVRSQLEAYLHAVVPPTVSWELTPYASGNPFLCDPTSSAHRAYARALTEVWNVEPVLSRSGGSVPVASDIEEILGVPSILAGFALPDDKIHSPNESQHIDNWYRGIDAVIRFFAHLAEQA